MACLFAEHSPDASSYQFKIQGLYSTHAFIYAIVVDIFCDNDAALKEASRGRNGLVVHHHAWTFFVAYGLICTSLHCFIGLFHWLCTWVKACMDDVIDWHDLSCTQQLNVMCNNLAKAAAKDVITCFTSMSHPPTSQLLPHKNIAVFVNSVKETLERATLTMLTGKICIYASNQNQMASACGCQSNTQISAQHKSKFRTANSRWPSCLQVEKRAEHLYVNAQAQENVSFWKLIPRTLSGGW